MSEKMYLNLFLFCCILCQGIFATFSDKNDRVSSDFLIRNKRVITHLPSGRNLTRIDTVKYIVKIKDAFRPVCAGAILSHYTVITAALCVKRPISEYQIQSGAAYDQRSNNHTVQSKAEYYGSRPSQPIDGIALITVDPPFEFGRRTGYIQLHERPLPAGTMVSVIGWGHLYPIRPGPDVRLRLHAINLPIMNHEECQTVYRDNSNRINLRHGVAVTDKHICTYCEQQYCARGDAGAPLVEDNKLAGIHVWKGEFEGRRNPDVYVNLERADYRNWITANTLLM